MKKSCYIILFLAMVCLSSCFEIDEQYDFKADGAVDVAYNVDFRKTLEILVSMVPDSTRKKDPQFQLKVDTTLNFYTASTAGARQKMNMNEADLNKNSNIKVQINISKMIMKVNISHSSKNTADLNYFLHNLSNIPTLYEPLSKVSKDDKKPGSDTSGARGLIAYADFYKFVVAPGKFYRVIDTAKFGAFSRKNKSTYEAAKNGKIAMPYKLTLNFASPVKSVTSSIAKVSADKKHVTIETDMAVVNSNPSILNLKVDY